MANCDNLFKEFNQRIKLSESSRQSLRTSRDSLRSKVKEKFKSENYDVKFYWQGSFAMNTIIAPKDSDYDIDDGIYIQGEDEPSVDIDTLRKWVVEAAKDHTSLPPKDKNTCVRVQFKDGYHIDLVIYHKKNQDHPKLAHKTKGWTISDPKEFMEWFRDRCDDKEQLKRLIRYFKGWADNVREEMPSGIILTILAASNFQPNERDDVAFLETMKAIHTRLSISFMCIRPTTPNEDLFADYPKTRKDYFMNKLQSFIQSGAQAIEEINQKDACPKWQRHFGDRFPCGMAEDTVDEAKAFSAPAFIKSDARSA